MTPLLKSVSTRDPSKEIVSYLLKVGADVDYQDMEGQTVLMYAVKCYTNKAIISLLLKSGADPTLTDERAYTVLHHAVLRKSLHAIKILCSSTNSCFILSRLKRFYYKKTLYCLHWTRPELYY